MAKKKTKSEKELVKNGFEPNEKPKTPEQEEIDRLLAKGREYGKGKN